MRAPSCWRPGYFREHVDDETLYLLKQAGEEGMRLLEILVRHDRNELELCHVLAALLSRRRSLSARGCNLSLIHVSTTSSKVYERGVVRLMCSCNTFYVACMYVMPIGR